MMDVTNTRCAGLDIHKRDVVACRLYEGDDGKALKDIASFETTTAGLLELRQWLKAVSIEQVAMESTGEYWKPVYTILEGEFEVLVVNAQHLKAVPGRKTDIKDAEWIAKLLHHGLLKGSFIPAQAQRDVRELTRLRSTVMADRARTVNRLQKVLEQANLKLASVVSDVMGTSARAMLNAIVEGQTDPKTLADLAQGRLREKVDRLEQALQGRVRDVHRFMLADALAQIDYYDERLARISQQIEDLLRPFDQQLSNLDTIPGIGKQVAQVILAEVGADMSRFPTDSHLAAWAGVAPGNNQSGGKRLSGTARKGSPALRRALVQAAHAASKTKHTYLSAQYHRLAARRGRKRAILAVAHSILVIGYHILKDGTTYQELGADFFDRRARDGTARHLTRRLQRLGFSVTVTDATATI
jgi:transposase